MPYQVPVYQPYPAQGSVTPRPQQQARPQPAPPSAALAAQPARPRAVRAQMPEEPPAPARLAALHIPTPAELGVTCAKPADCGEVDWTALHRRFQALGATCFHMDKLTDGGYRFICLLPTAQPQRSHRVEAIAASEAEAVRSALDQAERWAKN